MTVVITDEAHLVSSTIKPHIRCCERDTFYCGAPFHPEAEATGAVHEDDACTRCVDRRYELLCPPDRPTHQHCALNVRKVCP
jgi:hypothetical protein